MLQFCNSKVWNDLYFSAVRVPPLYMYDEFMCPVIFIATGYLYTISEDHFTGKTKDKKLCIHKLYY